MHRPRLPKRQVKTMQWLVNEMGVYVDAPNSLGSSPQRTVALKMFVDPDDEESKETGRVLVELGADQYECWYTPAHQYESAPSTVDQPLRYPARECARCGISTGLKTCQGCKQVKYCSKSCQTKHWKHEHKGVCSTLSASSTASRG